MAGVGLSPRFGAEAMFFFLVAAVLVLLEAGRTVAVLSLFAAWLLVAALEVTRAARPRRTRDGAGTGKAFGGLERPQPVAGADPFAPQPGASSAPDGDRTAGVLQPLGVTPFDERGPEPQPVPPPAPLLAVAPPPGEPDDDGGHEPRP